VLWLAAATSGENIRDAGGWVVSVGVAVIFYAGAFAILGLWRRRAANEVVSRRLRVGSHAAIVFIGAVFVSSYAARSLAAPGFGIPALVMTAAIGTYLKYGGWSAISAGSGQVTARS
jgi:hypothetical protein